MGGLSAFVPSLLQGLLTTIYIGAINIALMMVISLVLLMGIRSGIGWLKGIVIVFTEFIRGNSIIVILFWAYYAVPILPGQIKVDGMSATIIAISLGAAAYAVEVLRAAANSVPGGQYEACEALGIGFWQRETRIILPQIWGLALPSLATLSVEIFKWSVVGSLVGVPELMYWGEAARTRTGQTLVIYAGLMLTYYLLAQAIFGIFKVLILAAVPGASLRSFRSGKAKVDDVGLPVYVR